MPHFGRLLSQLAADRPIRGRPDEAGPRPKACLQHGEAAAWADAACLGGWGCEGGDEGDEGQVATHVQSGETTTPDQPRSTRQPGPDPFVIHG